MAFKNKFKNKKKVKFCSSRGLNLIDPTKFLLQTKNVDRLKTFFLTRLNVIRMLKVAFATVSIKYLKRRRQLKKNFFILDFLSQFEMRVGNTFYNTGLSISRFEVKQLVHKRKILINGSRIKSHNITVAAKDIISVDKSVWVVLKRQVFKKTSMFLYSRYFEINYNIFTLIILHEKLDHKSVIFLSNKLSKINFRIMDN